MGSSLKADNEHDEGFDFMAMDDDMKLSTLNKMSLVEFWVLLQTNKDIYDFCMTAKGVNIDFYIPTLSVERQLDGIHSTSLSRLSSFSEVAKKTSELPITVNIKVLYLHCELDPTELSLFCNDLKTIPVKTISELHIYDDMSCWEELLEFMKEYKVKCVHMTGDVTVPVDVMERLIEGNSFPELKKVYCSAPIPKSILYSRIPDLTFSKAVISPQLIANILKRFLTMTDAAHWYFMIKWEPQALEQWDRNHWENLMKQSFNTRIIEYDAFKETLPDERPLLVKQGEFVLILREDGRIVKTTPDVRRISIQLGADEK